MNSLRDQHSAAHNTWTLAGIHDLRQLLVIQSTTNVNNCVASCTGCPTNGRELQMHAHTNRHCSAGGCCVCCRSCPASTTRVLRVRTNPPACVWSSPVLLEGQHVHATIADNVGVIKVVVHDSITTTLQQVTVVACEEVWEAAVHALHPTAVTADLPVL